jgi:hypothetical protein
MTSMVLGDSTPKALTPSVNTPFTFDTYSLTQVVAGSDPGHNLGSGQVEV